ncbi:signal peptide peptidase-like [Musa troglodytarum]|nr:signal peptide peptidase-like [Musa troglodytarum]
MVCTKNETHLNITIPVVMIPKSAGDYLRGSMSSSGKVDILLYSPTRPILDISVVFLVLMAVGTIVSASFWDEFTAHEQVGEHYNQSRWKQDQPSAETNQEDTEKNTLKIKAVGAIAFVIVASAFLVVLFFFMSSSFVFALNVIFSLAGSQGMHFCIVSLISRASKHCRQMKINIPIIGKVSVIAIVVLPFCIAFSIIWVGNRHSPHAWIGQDILGITLMITVLQVLELPNIKVASVLLCCAFFYDIFWVFLSPLIFHQSVMIAVSSYLFFPGPFIITFMYVCSYMSFDVVGGHFVIARNISKLFMIPAFSF